MSPCATSFLLLNCLLSRSMAVLVYNLFTPYHALSVCSSVCLLSLSQSPSVSVSFCVSFLLFYIHLSSSVFLSLLSASYRSSLSFSSSPSPSVCVSLHPCVPVPVLFSIGVITPISISTSRHFTAPSISLFHPSSPCPGQPICSPPLPSRPVSLCPSLQPPPPPPLSVSLTLTHCHRRLFPISYAHRYLPFDRFVDYNVPPAPRESSHTTDAENDCRRSTGMMTKRG